MNKSLTVADERRRQMVALYPRTHGPECPDKYRAIAEWWRLHAEESANSGECYVYAENQERLADDMEQRPNHYHLKPRDTTYYHWSTA